MPDMNGYDTTRKLRQREKETGAHVPVIALTADAMKGTQEKCDACGMDEYITKPIDAEELKEVLSYWIDFPSSPAETAKGVTDKGNIANLSILKEYADTPAEMHNFIDVFLSQSRESLNELGRYCVEGECVDWTEAAHKLKGGAGMIGAQYLSNLCETAQGMRVCDAARRSGMYQKIKSAFDDVELFLQQHIPA